MIDSRSNIKDILAVAKDKGLDVISITDHDEIEGSLEAVDMAGEYGLIAIPGVEVSTREGHLLAYGITKKVPRKLSLKETVEYVKDLGGIVATPHPFSPQGIFFRGKNKELVGKLDLDATEVFGVLRGMCQKSQAVAEEHDIPQIAGSDSKTLLTVGDVYTEIEVSDRSSEGVLKAIKAGRVRPVVVKRHSPARYALWQLLYNYFIS